MVNAWVLVASCANRADAEVRRSFLASEQIEARLDAADIGGLAPHLGLTGGYGLVVQQRDEAAARAALERVAESGGQAPR